MLLIKESSTYYLYIQEINNASISLKIHKLSTQYNLQIQLINVFRISKTGTTNKTLLSIKIDHLLLDYFNKNAKNCFARYTGLH